MIQLIPLKKNKITTNGNITIDDKLKTDIKNANDAIGDLKKSEQRFEEIRLTGGESTSITDDILEIINNDEYKKSGKSLFDEINKSNFFDESGNVLYIEIPKLEDIFDNDSIVTDIKKIYKKHEIGIGKGEYFLPLLYSDVHKKRPFGTDPYTKKRVKGDNYILNNNNIYNLELKSPGATFNFSTKNLHEQKNITESVLKHEIAKKFLQYVKKQNTENTSFIMCIFDKINHETNIPKGMMFINLSSINNENENNILNKLEGMIKISYSGIDKSKFSFTLINDNELNCKVNNCYNTTSIKEESTILNFERFVNEIYKIKRGL